MVDHLVAEEFCEVKFNPSADGLDIQVETQNLFIRSYRDSDLDSCIDLYGDPIITKYFDHGAPRSEVEVQDLVALRGASLFKNNIPLGLFSVFLKETGEFVGQVDLLPTDDPSTVEIGCILFQQFQSSGIGTEATRAMIFQYTRVLFEKGYRNLIGLPIDKIMGTVHPNNRASLCLVRKIGMVFQKNKERFGKPRMWFLLHLSY